MEEFKEFLDSQEPIHREKLTELFEWILAEFPELDTRIAWNQPMFTYEGTFIIAFSCSKNHCAVAPEGIVIEKFSEEIKKRGLDFSKQIIRIPWNNPFDYDLIKELIAYNIHDKRGYQTFWRK